MNLLARSGLLLAPILLTGAAPVPRVLATCVDLKGRIFQTSPDKGWAYRRMKGAVLTILRERAGRYDVLLQEGGQTTSLRRDGATLRITHSSRDFSYFIMTATWQAAQLDGFQVTFLPDGRGRLVWNSLRSHMPPRDETAAAMLTGTCKR